MRQRVPVTPNTPYEDLRDWLSVAEVAEYLGLAEWTILRRFVTPHDIIDLCRRCNTTLTAVAEATGLMEAELLPFAAGCVGLSARDRIEIFLAITRNCPETCLGDENHVRSV